MPYEGKQGGYDCYTPSMFYTREDAEFFSKEFEESLKEAIRSGIKDVDEGPWTEIFIKKVKQCKRKPGYLSEWIDGYERESGTGAKRTASKQSSGGQKVDEKEAVPQAVGNDDASKKQRNSSRRGESNSVDVFERSFEPRDRDKAVRSRNKAKQDSVNLSKKERELIKRWEEEIEKAKEKFATLYGAKIRNNEYTLLYKTTENDGIESIYGVDVNRGWLSDAEYNRVVWICHALLLFYQIECGRYSDALKTRDKKAPSRPFEEVIERMKKDAALYESAQEGLPEERRVKGLEMSVKTLRKYVSLFEENDGIPESRRGKNESSTFTQFPQIGIEMLDYGGKCLERADGYCSVEEMCRHVNGVILPRVYESSRFVAVHEETPDAGKVDDNEETPDDGKDGKEKHEVNEESSGDTRKEGGGKEEESSRCS